MTINVQVDHIVLDGFALTEAQQAIFRQSVMDGLAALLADKPDRQWRQSRRQSVVQPPAIELAGNDPAQLGRELARVIHAELTR